MPRSGEEDLSPWKTFTISNGPWQEAEAATGRLFDLSVVHTGGTWYPAAGYRESSRYYYQDGRLLGVTMYCHNHTTSVTTAESYIFHYNSDDIYPSHTYSRASGIPVRCIRE